MNYTEVMIIKSKRNERITDACKYHAQKAISTSSAVNLHMSEPLQCIIIEKFTQVRFTDVDCYCFM